MDQARAGPRVLHVDDQPTWCDGLQQVLYLVRALASRGVPAAVSVQPESRPAEAFRRAGIDVHEVHMRGETDLGAAWRIAQLACRGRFNVLHAHTAHAHALALMASLICRRRCRVVVHRRLARPVGRGLFGLGVLKYRVGVDAYIAVSGAARTGLLSAGLAPQRVFVVHDATDAEQLCAGPAEPVVRESLGIPPEALVVGAAGALVRRKGYDSLLEACRIVRDRFPQTWLVIGGDGPLRRSLMAKATSMHMDDRLVLAASSPDTAQLVRAFDVFVLSSSSEGGFGGLLDVAACGCPIVATDVGAVRELIDSEEAGVVVPPDSPVALARGIGHVVEDRSRAAAMAARARRRATRQFGVRAMVTRVVNVYERVLGTGAGRERLTGLPGP
jgi:glycosyltransferase involved in cell wall biosynthesis